MAALGAALFRLGYSCHCRIATLNGGAQICKGYVSTCARRCPVLLRSYSLFNSTDTVFALSSGHGKCGESS